MIAHKVLPAMFILDVEGEAANLESVFGANCGIKRVTIGSNLFDTDLAAVDACVAAIGLFPSASGLGKQEFSFNPEFFPSLPKLEVPENFEDTTGMSKGELTKMILTQNFDSLGDFIAIKGSAIGPDFTMTMKIAVNPVNYVEEKSRVEVEKDDRAFSPHRETYQGQYLH